MNGKLAVVLLFLPPALFLFTVFVALPMGEAAWYSFYNWNGYGTPETFVGLKQLRAAVPEPRLPHRARQQPADHRRSRWQSSCPLALLAAILLADRIRGAVTFRMIFFLPYVLAEIAAGLIWRFVYDGDYGLLANVARRRSASPRRMCSRIAISRCTPSWSSSSGSTSAST